MSGHDEQSEENWTHKNPKSSTSLCHATIRHEVNCGGRKTKEVMRRNKEMFNKKNSAVEIAIIEILI